MAEVKTPSPLPLAELATMPMPIAHTNSALAKVCQSALEAFNTQGLPGRKNELWKYTPLNSLLAKRNFTLPRTLKDLKRLPAEVQVDPEAMAIVISGAVVLIPENLPKGLHIQDLFEAVEDWDERMIYAMAEHGDSMDCLHWATLAGGLSIVVDPGVKLKRPLEIIYQAVDGKPTYQSIALQIHLFENSELKLIEHVGAPAGQDAIHSRMQLTCFEGAKATFIQAAHGLTDSVWFGNVEVQQYANSQFKAVVQGFHQGLARLSVKSELVGEHASFDVKGMAVLKDQSHFNLYAEAMHQASHTQSAQLYRAVADGQAASTYRGRAVIQKGLEDVAATQYNRNLLLAKTAQINTKPELEIYSDDVRCAHGATVAQLDDEQLFYLLSRGIDLEAAREMITKGFLKTLVERIEDDWAKELMAGKLTQCLQSYFQLASEEA